MPDLDPLKALEVAFAAGVAYTTAKLIGREALRLSRAALSKLDALRNEFSEYREAKAEERGKLTTEIEHLKSDRESQQRQLDVFRQQLTDALLFAEDARERRQRGR